MDFEDWEILPRGGFIDYHEDEEKEFNSKAKGKFNMNYFVCPDSPPRMLVKPNRVVPVSFEWEPTSPKEVQVEVVPLMAEIKGPDLVPKESDQDPISQVFFKKMKENEFVDMKIDSPKSPTKGFVDAAGKLDFQDKGEILEAKICSPRNKEEEEEEVNWEENERGMNLWKWSLSGIGAICSFGVAAATVCVVIFGSQQRIKHHSHGHKLRFQLYADDKRIKQVVQQATKLNEAITTARGVPMARAHITYGGYYEAL